MTGLLPLGVTWGTVEVDEPTEIVRRKFLMYLSFRIYNNNRLRQI